MTKHEFTQQMETLSHAFSNADQGEKKLKVYFENLGHIEFDKFRLIVAACIKKMDRFPSIAQILEVYAAVNPPQRKIEARCDRCDGYGWKKLGYQVYRGDCAHGQKLSKSIKVCPSEDKRYIELFNQKNDLISVYGEDAAKRMFGKNT